MGLVAASLLPLSHGARLYSAQNTFVQESVSSQAVVVDLQPAAPEPGKARSSEVYSVVEFTDDSGTRRQARTNVGSYPALHDIGEQINVRFHLQNKDDVRVESFTGMWFESAFYLIPGLLCLVGGFLMIYTSRLQGRN